MKTNILPILLMGIAPGLVSAATWQGTASVDFSVGATMHTVEGTAEATPFEVTVEDGDGLRFTVEVPIEGMDTGNKKRDEEMRHVLREDLQPVLVGTLPPTPLTGFKPGEQPSTLNFMFKMADQNQPVVGTVTDWEESESELSFTVEFDISQLAYGLEPISKMGFLKVKDTVHVATHFVLQK